jgi:hypothetical protein
MKLITLYFVHECPHKEHAFKAFRVVSSIALFLVTLFLLYESHQFVLCPGVI